MWSFFCRWFHATAGFPVSREQRLVAHVIYFKFNRLAHKECLPSSNLKDPSLNQPASIVVLQCAQIEPYQALPHVR